ncbi:hypothetical protein [Streptomyces zaomyceticus]|uniref:hypothetical protein n=1 Tax=Streptomyces zaomyceticus TaxID=68286 RepID=UPI0037AC7F12
MAPRSIDPRPLNADERAALEHILSAEFAGASQLRSQLDHTEVIDVWGPDSVSVDLRVREPCEHAAMPTELVPVDAYVHDPSGTCVGKILVRTDRGATLADLEFAWFTDEMPTSLPAVVDGRLSPRVGAPDSARSPGTGHPVASPVDH